MTRIMQEGEVRALAPIISERWEGAVATALVACPAVPEPMTRRKEAGTIARAEAALSEALCSTAAVMELFAEQLRSGERHGRIVVLQGDVEAEPAGSWQAIAAAGLRERAKSLAGQSVGVGILDVGAGPSASELAEAVVHGLTAPASVVLWEARLSGGL